MSEIQIKNSDGEIIQVSAEVVKKIDTFDLNSENTNSLALSYHPFFSQVSELKNEAMKIKVTHENKSSEVDRAKKMKKKFISIRTDLDSTRKVLKEDSLRKGQAIDGVARFIRSFLDPIEEHLKNQVDFEKIEREKEVAKLQSEREKELEEKISKYETFVRAGIVADFGINYFSGVGEMEKVEWEDYRKKIFDCAEKIVREEEEEARLKKEEEERNEKLKADNERLKKEKKEEEDKRKKLEFEKNEEEKKKREEEEKKRVEKEREEKKIKDEKFLKFLKENGVEKCDLDSGFFKILKSEKEEGIFVLYKMVGQIKI